MSSLLVDVSHAQPRYWPPRQWLSAVDLALEASREGADCLLWSDWRELREMRMSSRISSLGRLWTYVTRCVSAPREIKEISERMLAVGIRASADARVIAFLTTMSGFVASNHQSEGDIACVEELELHEIYCVCVAERSVNSLRAMSQPSYA